MERFTEALAEYYTHRSSTYDRSEFHQRLSQRLVEAASIERGNKVLDIATGTGLLAFRAAAIVGSHGKVVGVDISDGMLDQARNKLAALNVSNVEFRKSDVQTMTFGMEKFDRIMCSSAFTFFNDIPSLLRRLSGLLNQNGLLAFDSPSKDAFITGVIVKQLAAKHGIQLKYGEECSTYARCRDVMQHAGFVDVVVSAVQFGSYIGHEEAVNSWDATLRHPLSQQLSMLPVETLQSMKGEFSAALRAAETEKGIWNDGTVFIVVGRKA